MSLDSVVFGQKRVLCVEDDATQRAILEPMLRMVIPQVKLQWAETAEEAFELLRAASKEHKRDRAPFDLVITDIFLDGKITGIDLWKVCGNIYPRMPTLIMSGLPFEKFSDFRAGDPAIPPYLQKPLKIQECLGKIRRALSEAQPEVRESPLISGSL